MDIEEEINRKTNDKYDLKLKSATLFKSSGVCHVEFFYKDGVILPASEREELEKELLSFLPQGFDYQFKFIKNFVVNEAVSEAVNKFLKSNFPSVPYEIKSVDCEEANKSVELFVDEKIMEFAIEKRLDKSLEKYLNQNFFATFSVSIFAKEMFEELVSAPEEEFVFEDISNRFIEVSDVKLVAGTLTDNLASYIKDKTAPEENVTICGRIKFIKEATYEKKKKAKEGEEPKEEKKDAENEKAEEEDAIRKYYKFAVEDFSGTMHCVFFPSKKNIEAVANLKAGDSVIVMGSITKNSFNSNIDMRVKSICLCTLPEKFEEEIVYKEEPKNYRFVTPEPVEYYSQVDLFAKDQTKVLPYFEKNKLVVFDFETTGLRMDGNDKIIEIGAVKLENGKMTESFSCLINPEMHITNSDLHGIKDDDVKDKPRYQDVLPDFFKFTRGCVLSGYNISGFDMIFLKHFGKLCGYNFDNPILDVYQVAQKQVKGVKNYKLGTISEKLGVKLDNAHRAVFDTMATAEVLLKMSEGMDDIENYEKNA